MIPLRNDDILPLADGVLEKSAHISQREKKSLTMDVYICMCLSDYLSGYLSTPSTHRKYSGE